jgi:hypothetical protein
MNTKAEVISGAIIETPEERDSVEVTRDAKGAHKFVVKLYFDSQKKDGEKLVLAKAKSIHDRLVKEIGE